MNHDFAHCDNDSCRDSKTCRRHTTFAQRHAEFMAAGNVYYLIHSEKPNGKDECQFYDPSIGFTSVELTPKRFTVKK